MISKDTLPSLCAPGPKKPHEVVWPILANPQPFQKFLTSCLFSCSFSLSTLCSCVTIFVVLKEFILSTSGSCIAFVILLHRGSCKHQLQGHCRSISLLDQSVSDEILSLRCLRGRWKLGVSNWDCCSLLLASVEDLFCRIKVRKWMNSPVPSFADNYFPSWRSCRLYFTPPSSPSVCLSCATMLTGTEGRRN